MGYSCYECLQCYMNSRQNVPVYNDTGYIILCRDCYDELYEDGHSFFRNRIGGKCDMCDQEDNTVHVTMCKDCCKKQSVNRYDDTYDEDDTHYEDEDMTGDKTKNENKGVDKNENKDKDVDKKRKKGKKVE
jgi:hypothetical protein